ncbi:hypothetical protein EVAR_100099_1 [Eumeta japonica]|uniref:Uncharacterized protein n=1 Tax=Eumeta variegata TaxID=151549 RepID=A0A4C1YXK5_EUMVA|nr:hypothetical protein EVAR_100099_1 [Eumeta japonica]
MDHNSGDALKNRIARTRRPRRRATPPRRSSPATRDIYTRVDLNNTGRTRVCPARVAVIAQAAMSKLRTGDNMGNKNIHNDLARTTAMY